MLSCTQTHKHTHGTIKRNFSASRVLFSLESRRAHRSPSKHTHTNKLYMCAHRTYTHIWHSRCDIRRWHLAVMCVELRTKVHSPAHSYLDRFKWSDVALAYVWMSLHVNYEFSYFNIRACTAHSKKENCHTCPNHLVNDDTYLGIIDFALVHFANMFIQ